jgi:hypothetical protein
MHSTRYEWREQCRRLTKSHFHSVSSTPSRLMQLEKLTSAPTLTVISRVTADSATPTYAPTHRCKQICIKKLRNKHLLERFYSLADCYTTASLWLGHLITSCIMFSFSRLCTNSYNLLLYCSFTYCLFYAPLFTLHDHLWLFTIASFTASLLTLYWIWTETL